jgi:cytosine/adenosine deaminase-related metal-dependent hydrolase
MATEHGAMTTPFGAGIGRLEVGRSADFVVINHERALFPFQDPQIGIVEAIMQRAKTAAVDATVIAGVTVYEDGVFTLIDRDATLREIAAIFARPRSAGEAEMVGFSREMQNFVRNFYDGYFDGAPGRPR